MTVATGPFAAHRPELLRIGAHDVVRWEADGRPRLTPLVAGPVDDEGLLAGVVFHTARCGSTLLAHLLAAGRGTRVLDEPSTVNAVLGDPSLSPDDRRSLLRRLAATARAGPVPAGAVVLKATSWNVLHADVLLAAFPDARAVFVLRDPLEVLVSLTERPPGWLAPEPGTSREEQAAIAVAGYLDAAARRLDRRWLLVRHEELPASAAGVARHLGTAAADVGRAASIAATDVKHPGRPWRGDGPAKRARASEAVRRAHRRLTEPAHRRLLAAFTERGA
jgi:hypothetical protein